MAIIVDNTTIQDCQGVITDNNNMIAVNADSERVYTENCFSGTWSGDTFTLPFPSTCCPAPNGETCVGRDHNFGLNTEGNRYQLLRWGVVEGAWLYADENGLDTGESRIINTTENIAIITTPTSIEWEFVPLNEYSTVEHSGSVTFDKENGFSGTQEAIVNRWYSSLIFDFVHVLRWETSGGQIRIYEKYHNDAGCTMFEGTGPWITLT